eukprot:220749-Chlamydomonas_euryale.AAC.1
MGPASLAASSLLACSMWRTTSDETCASSASIASSRAAARRPHKRGDHINKTATHAKRGVQTNEHVLG